MYIGLHVKYLNFFRQTFEKYSKPNFMKIRPVGAELLHADRQTEEQMDRWRDIVAFRNMADAPKTMRMSILFRNIP